ncbi:hypothetical protein HMPREF1544_05617 [Mucor circinelloides 1006PhL]|uniref:Uncharacterized protein n=1 Tax=Mucor circinelloides f. circinelloides (strain 1006PhL) TaxID=1220926 RepID=S2JXW7_MUCC1|nr:hypothetical protein HMPREF1544_05617 [Mucor circinelloides 1006PhL]
MVTKSALVMDQNGVLTRAKFGFVGEQQQQGCQRRKRSKAWAPISFMFLIYALPQAFSMGTIAYLYNSSATFYMGTRYNFSFIFCIISWILSIMLSVVLSLIAILSPPEYAYQQLD